MQRSGQKFVFDLPKCKIKKHYWSVRTILLNIFYTNSLTKVPPTPRLLKICQDFFLQNNVLIKQIIKAFFRSFSFCFTQFSPIKTCFLSKLQITTK